MLNENVKQSRRIVIFGAGQIGRQALTMYKGNVKYFIDNDEKLQGTLIDGVSVKSINAILEDTDDFQIVIASAYQKSMEQQLKDLGVKNYELYLEKFKAYYVTDEIVFNPYVDNPNRDVTEDTWNQYIKNSVKIEMINKEVEEIHNQNKIFSHVEIETVNRCNGTCEFCPVSKMHDSREYLEMSERLFQDIIEQLAEINYNGKLALFSNNEPFLDKNIIQKHKYAREKLPNAKMHLFTNGTLLTVDKFVEIMKYLDELIIDNYQQDLKLIKPCKEIESYCMTHPEYRRKVTIVLRKPKEILSTRGGDAPNRREKVSYGNARCILPYKQLIIRPDGKVSLCCNDPLGKNTLGDLTKSNILDVWNNDRFKMVRECLYEGRAKWKHCEYCDHFSMG